MQEISNLQWLIGLCVTFLIAHTTVLVGVLVRLSQRQSTGFKDVYEKIDNIRDRYVRRDDLTNHIDRLDKNVDDLRNEIHQSRREMNTRLDALIAAFSDRPFREGKIG